MSILRYELMLSINLTQLNRTVHTSLKNTYHLCVSCRVLEILATEMAHQLVWLWL